MKHKKIKAKGTQKKKSDMKTIFQNFQGFDHEGNDPFWTVTGDNVTSLILSDYTKVKGRTDLYCVKSLEVTTSLSHSE